MRYHESNLQIACVTWYRLQYNGTKYRDLLFSIPNGGKRNSREAARMKKEGTVAGVPDLMLAVPTATYGGMFIEMKVKGGKVSESQCTIQDQLFKIGYFIAICYSFDDFRSVIGGYFELKDMKK